MNAAYWSELIGDGVTELFDIDVDRADLVAYPAIKRRFLLVKSNEDAHQNTNKQEEDMKEVIEVLKSLVVKIDDGRFSDQAVDLFDRLQKCDNEEEVNGLLKELEEAFGDNDTITKTQFEEWQTKAEALVEVEKDEDEESDEEETEGEVVFKSDVDLDAEDENEDEDEEEDKVAKVEKSLSEKIEKQAAELKEAKVEFKKAQKEIETLRIEKQTKELIDKASTELCHLGKSAEDIGGLLMSLRLAGVPDEIFTGLYDLLKSNSEMIKESGFFNEFGTSAEPDDSDPEVKMMNDAKNLVEKGDFETVPQAYAHLYKSAVKE